MAILNTRNTGTGNRLQGMQGMREMFTRIPGNLLKDSGECYQLNIPGMFKKFPGNVQEDSGECSRRFRLMFQKNMGNVIKDSGKFSRKFRGMYRNIP